MAEQDHFDQSKVRPYNCAGSLSVVALCERMV